MLERINADQKLKDLAFVREKREMDDAQIRYEGKREGLKQGREEGITIGTQQKSIEVALELLQLGLSDEQIIKVTKLDEETVVELKTKGNKVTEEII